MDITFKCLFKAEHVMVISNVKQCEEKELDILGSNLTSFDLSKQKSLAQSTTYSIVPWTQVTQTNFLHLTV